MAAFAGASVEERHFAELLDPMRVIAGQYRSRPLRSLTGTDIRPTADRLRETLFNVLCAGKPEALTGSVWLDLYAGTGAVGIEALSRGAATVYFVESSTEAAELIAANLKSLGIVSGFKIVKAEAAKALPKLTLSGIVADFVFLDPPYALQDEYARTLRSLAGSKLLQPQTVVIAEHKKQFDPGADFASLQRYRTLTQGDATLSFYRPTTI
jgi:16S rRNA (guanine966-N2)-methyltransferase